MLYYFSAEPKKQKPKTSRTQSGEKYKPHRITKEENYLAYQESGKQKWLARAQKDFKEDLRLGNLDEYIQKMPMSEIKHRYIEGYIKTKAKRLSNIVETWE